VQAHFGHDGFLHQRIPRVGCAERREAHRSSRFFVIQHWQFGRSPYTE
jgi:hypothetical protein